MFWVKPDCRAVQSPVSAAHPATGLTAASGLLSGASLTTLTAANPLICVSVSLVIGGLFGVVSEKFAGMIKGAGPAAAKV